jgi:flagellar protein FliS
MKLNNASAQYKEQDALTASQPALILMTYDAALRFTKEAQKFMAERDIPAKNRAVESAFACVADLQRALNEKRGGEVAKSLGSLYQFMTSQITRANLLNDPSLLEPVQKCLTTLRAGWQEGIQKLRQEGQLEQFETPVAQGLVAR